MPADSPHLPPQASPHYQPLDPTEPSQARRLHELLQAEHRRLAEALGLGADFPPLRRGVRELQDAGACWIGALQGDALVGALGSCSDADDPSLTRIVDLVVRPEWQRQGVGSCLLHALSLDQGTPARLSLELAEANEAALAFFRRAGFREVRRWLQRWDGGQLRMLKLLR